MSETTVDLHSKFYIPYGLKRRIKTTIFDIQDVLYDALQEPDIKKDSQGALQKVELSAEEITKRNKLSMQIEIRYDTEREIEFSRSEVEMLKKLLVKPLSRGYDNIVIAQALAYVEGKTESDSLYFKVKYEKQEKNKFNYLNAEKMSKAINQLGLNGFSTQDIITAILIENSAVENESPGKVTTEFLEIVDPDDEPLKTDTEPDEPAKNVSIE